MEELKEKKKYGGKAFWLSWLSSNNYNIPPTIFIPVISNNNIEDLDSFLSSKKFLEQLDYFRIDTDLYSVAIRSSGSSEDDNNESLAGHFDTIIGEMSYKDIIFNIKKVIKSVNQYFSNDYEIGVIVQKKINASFSGIIFSSNPINTSKKELLISAIQGSGQKLVAGQEVGEDVLIKNIDNDFIIKDYKIKIHKSLFYKISSIAKEIEDILSFPVDIEWCIEENTNELFLLQCRPVTGMYFKRLGVLPIDIVHESLIPDKVINNDKVQIRLQAQKNNILVSNAYLVIQSDLQDQVEKMEINKITPAEITDSFSVVLIHPKTISGKIIREFASIEKKKQEENYRECQRYGIRKYLDYDSLNKAVNLVQSSCDEDYWTCISIIQEIFVPKYTGIIKRIKNGYLIEIAKGHFVAKGIVKTSQYIIDFDFKIVRKKEISQFYQYTISKGEIKKEKGNYKINLNIEDLHNIINKLSALFNEKHNLTVEFGLLEIENKLTPYLIDLIDDTSEIQLDTDMIMEGVLSQGKIEGNLLPIDLEEGKSFHLHYHDSLEQTKKYNGKYIFLCQTPDIGLLKILKNYDNRNIGFIFKDGSILSHFAIILREKKIPAIILKSEISITKNFIVHIDAESEGIRPMERVKIKGKNYVTSYINPDLDGIACMLGYSYYKKHFFENFTPIVFGKFDLETKFLFSQIGLELPECASEQIELNGNPDNMKIINQIVLVDTHNLNQLPSFIKEEMVYEIIDHHNLEKGGKFSNTKIQNEAVGSATTLLVEKIKKANIKPSNKIAYLCASAIISNTLNFVAPSTSQRDIEAYQWLQNFCNIENDFITSMFEARSNFINYPIHSILSDNTKKFLFKKTVIGICQIETTNIVKVIESNSFEIECEKFQKHNLFDYFFFSGVDIIEKKTYVFTIDKKSSKLLKKLFHLQNDNKLQVFDRVLLRKTDFVPLLERNFKITV